MKKKNHPQQDPTAKELDSIKRLLILALLKSGASAREIAKTLHMDEGNFSRAYGIGRIKRFGDE